MCFSCMCFFAHVNFCPFSLPLGVRHWRRLMIVAIPVWTFLLTFLNGIQQRLTVGIEHRWQHVNFYKPIRVSRVVLIPAGRSWTPVHNTRHLSEIKKKHIKAKQRLNSANNSEQCHSIWQLAKPTFRSDYAHTPFTEQSDGSMETGASKVLQTMLKWAAS